MNSCSEKLKSIAHRATALGLSDLSQDELKKIIFQSFTQAFVMKCQETGRTEKAVTILRKIEEKMFEETQSQRKRGRPIKNPEIQNNLISWIVESGREQFSKQELTQKYKELSKDKSKYLSTNTLDRILKANKLQIKIVPEAEQSKIKKIEEAWEEKPEPIESYTGQSPPYIDFFDHLDQIPFSPNIQMRKDSLSFDFYFFER